MQQQAFVNHHWRFSGGIMAQSEQALAKSLITVLDPRGQPTAKVESLPMAPRFPSLENRTVYLVDVGFGGGFEFLEEVVRWFSRNMPSVKTVLRRKNGNMFEDDPRLWAEIKDQNAAVVFGVGG
jgi:hypothetical protein